MLRKTGLILLVLVCLQLLLGVVATIAVLMRGDGGGIPSLEVLATSAHQANGALLRRNTAGCLVLPTSEALSEAHDHGGGLIQSFMRAVAFMSLSICRLSVPNRMLEWSPGSMTTSTSMSFSWHLVFINRAALSR